MNVRFFLSHDIKITLCEKRQHFASLTQRCNERHYITLLNL